MSKSKILVGANSAALIVSGMLFSVPLTGWAQMEEIVVSTRRKTESVQDVPIAVDVISSEQISRQGLNSVADLTKLSTSVQFDQSFGPADTRIAVRGLSNTRGRSNVAFLVDGVDTTTENFVSAGSGLLTNQRLLVDVERVEIVKGPQSALFGRAAFAGAISYTTKDPGDEFEGDVTLRVGDYGLLEVGGSMGGPVKGLEDVLGFRVSGAYWTEDGQYDNGLTGSNVGGEEGWGTAITALWTPVDEVRVKWRTEYSDSQYDQRPNVRIGGGSTGRSDGGVTQGLTFFPYPTDPANIQGEPGGSTATRLQDFGQYGPLAAPVIECSPEIRAVQNLAPNEDCYGIWQPTNYGGAGALQPMLSEDAVTGKDLTGTDTQLLRSTLNAEIAYDYFTISSITGWTDYDAFDELDQDYQAVLNPRTIPGHPVELLDGLISNQLGRSRLETEQFSQELRFQSNFDGPVQFTVGTLFWREDRRQDDLNYIIACAEYGKAGPFQVWPDEAALVSGLCDGTESFNRVGNPNIPGSGVETITSWQERTLDVFPCQYDQNGDPVVGPDGKCVRAPRTGAPWRADTEHKSIYFQVSWDLTDTWTLEFENRTIWEEFELQRTNKSSCTNLFFAFGTGTDVRVDGEKELPVADPNWEDIACEAEFLLNPNLPTPPSNPNGEWFLSSGTEKTYFNTPKFTAKWQTTDSMQTYFSWGIGKKPGGISTLAGGGSATNIEDQRYDPEEVIAWEVGMKSDFEVAGDLRLNMAGFLNDYTAKQIGTQRVDSSGTLQPIIINVDAAQVWGVEIEATWFPEFLEGLLLSGGYTWLQAEYTDFIDETRSLIRASYAGECEIIVKGGDNFCAIDLSGNKLERTPEHAFVGNLQFTRQFLDTDSDWFFEFTGTYQDKRFVDADNAAFFDAYMIFDTRLGLTNENWELLFFVDNLFDDDTIQTGGSGPDFANQVGELGFTAGLGVSHFFGVLPEQRQFGAQLTVRF